MGKPICFCNPEKLVTIEIRGGNVENITNPDDVYIWICDWDNLNETGIECPYCGETSLYIDGSCENHFICNGCNGSFGYVADVKESLYFDLEPIKDAMDWLREEQENEL